MSGSASANPIATGTGIAVGTAGYFRIRNLGNTITYADGTCGTSGADMIFDNNSILTGGTVAITGFTIGVPVG